MTQYETHRRLELRVLIIALALICLPLFAVTATAQPTGAGNNSGTSSSTGSFTDPAQIDRAVTEFTGAPIGETGGARVPADRRLRLAACAAPLGVSWHGQSRSTLQVACAGPESWRIFIATRPAPQSAVAAAIVSRGDPITVVVRGRGFTVQQTGEAMDGGSVGDWIAIRTTRDTAPVRARIVRPGMAVIPAS